MKSGLYVESPFTTRTDQEITSIDQTWKSSVAERKCAVITKHVTKILRNKLVHSDAIKLLKIEMPTWIDFSVRLFLKQSYTALILK